MKINIHGFEISEPVLSEANKAYDNLLTGAIPSKMTGWLTPTDNEVVARCTELGAKFAELSDVVVVVGIGGSYLGAKAVAELLPNNGKLRFAGNTLSGAYYDQLLRELEDKDFSVIVVSKSGGTVEPGIGFRIMEQTLIARYGAIGACSRLAAVTSSESSLLGNICSANGYTRLALPENIGGRYSVFSAAGLLPLAAGGIDIASLVNGTTASNVNRETIVTYAAARQTLYRAGKKLEVLSAWEPNVRWLGEWYKQLFGESEGKDGRGLFPVSLELTADLHSMGQYMQDGERLMFETMLSFNGSANVTVPARRSDDDKLNMLSGVKLDEVNRILKEAVISAHLDGGIPVIELIPGRLTAESAGELMHFMMTSCAVSGLTMGVDPFDQPGVEAYKSKAKALFAHQNL
jgi:glucose-6-phosphate isomerase